MLLLEESAMEDFEGINCDQPNSVVVGLAPLRSDYDHLNDAFRLKIYNITMCHSQFGMSARLPHFRIISL